MSKEWFEYSKEELLQLPQREWDKTTWDRTTSYGSILFVNTRKKHESGYNLFAIIGCKDGSHPTEICGYMDSFRFDAYSKKKELYDITYYGDISFDCSMRGVFRLSSRRKIYVGYSSSTTDWWLGERFI